MTPDNRATPPATPAPIQVGGRFAPIDLIDDIVDAAYAVHRALGPGLTAEAYQACMNNELVSRGHTVERHVALSDAATGKALRIKHKIDLVVDTTAAVDVRSVESIDVLHSAQLVAAMELGRLPRGVLVNFNVHDMSRGIVRKELPRPVSES